MPNTDYSANIGRSEHTTHHAAGHNCACAHGKRELTAEEAAAKKAKRKARREEMKAAVSDDGDEAWEDVKKTPKKRKAKRYDTVHNLHFGTVVHTMPAGTVHLHVGPAPTTPSPKAHAATPSPRQTSTSPQVGSPSQGGFWAYLAQMAKAPLEPARIGDDVYMLPK